MKKLTAMVIAFVIPCVIGGVAFGGLNDGLVAHWSFDNQSNPGHDDSGNGNHGTVHGATRISNGVQGGAMSFDGVDDNIQIWSATGMNENIDTTVGAFSVWFKPQNKQEGFVFMYFGVPSNNDRFYLYLNPGYYDEVVFAIGNGGIESVSPITYGNDVWYHVVCQWYPDGTIKLYLNGIKEKEDSFGNPGFVFGGSEYFRLGEGWAGDPHHYSGAIDEVRIYNRALSEAEIQALYYQSQIELNGCLPTLPSVKNLVSTIQALKDFIDGNYPSLSELYDPGSDGEQIIDGLEYGDLFQLSLSTSGLDGLYDFITNIANLDIQYTFSPVADGTLVTSNSSQCLIPGFGIDPFEEIIVESQNGTVTVTFTLDGSAISFTIEPVVDLFGIGLSVEMNWDNISTDFEIYLGPGIVLPATIGFHGEIIIEQPNTTYTLIVNDPASMRNGYGKVGGYAGCDLSLHAKLGGGLNVSGELYLKAPLSDVFDYAGCVDDCVMDLPADPSGSATERIEDAIGQFVCLGECLVPDYRVGVGMGLRFGAGVGVGASGCVGAKATLDIEGGLSVKFETPPHCVLCLVGNSALAEFLSWHNQLNMIMGKIPSKSKILSLPSNLWHGGYAFWTAHRKAKILKDLLEVNCPECLTDTRTKLYLGGGFGGKLKVGGGLGVHGSIDRGLETNLETLLSAFAFDVGWILDNGYGGLVLREAGEIQLAASVVGVKGAFLKDLIKAEVQRTVGAGLALTPLSPTISANVIVSLDEGVDSDSDGLYDTLRINGSLDVYSAGTYLVGGMLYKGETCVGHSTVPVELLNPGTQSFILDFDGLHLNNTEENGPYTFGAIVVREDDQTTVFESDSVYTTGAFNSTEFQDSQVEITGVSYIGVDDDTDGLFDFLKATLTLNSNKTMDVIAEGSSTDNRLNLFGSSTGSIPTGTSQIEILLDGKEIRTSGLDAPYELKFTVFDDKHEPHSALEDKAVGLVYSNFQLPKISLSNFFEDNAVDTDSDGLFDFLDINIGVVVTEPGTYELSAVLEGENNSFNISNRISVDETDDVITLSLEGPRIRNTATNQSYSLTNLTLIDENSVVYGERQHPFTTSTYNFSDFEPDKIALTGVYTDQGVDLNSNGLYDCLRIDVGIDVQQYGFYRIAGHLKCGQNYITSETGVLLYPGQRTVSLTFYGPDIRDKGHSGTYELERVGIVVEDEYVAYCDGVCHNCTYDYQDFDTRCEGDFDGDRDVDGSDLAALATNPDLLELTTFAADFGRADCPTPE